MQAVMEEDRAREDGLESPSSAKQDNSVVIGTSEQHVDQLVPAEDRPGPPVPNQEPASAGQATQPDSEEAEAGAAQLATAELPQSASVPDAEPTAAATDAFDDDDDDFGDFDSAPPAQSTPAPETVNPAVTAQDDDDFGDFSTEPAMAPAAAAAVSQPAEFTQPAADSTNLLSLQGDDFKAAVSSKWATAFGSQAAIGSGHQQQPDISLLETAQQARCTRTAAHAGTVFSYGGVPLQSTTPSSTGSHDTSPELDTFKPAVTCSYPLSWRNSASEARLLHSLGLQEAAALAAVAEAAAASQPPGKKYGSATAILPYTNLVTNARVGLADKASKSRTGSEGGVQGMNKSPNCQHMVRLLAQQRAEKAAANTHNSGIHSKQVDSNSIRYGYVNPFAMAASWLAASKPHESDLPQQAVLEQVQDTPEQGNQTTLDTLVQCRSYSDWLQHLQVHGAPTRHMLQQGTRGADQDRAPGYDGCSPAAAAALQEDMSPCLLGDEVECWPLTEAPKVVASQQQQTAQQLLQGFMEDAQLPELCHQNQEPQQQADQRDSIGARPHSVTALPQSTMIQHSTKAVGAANDTDGSILPSMAAPSTAAQPQKMHPLTSVPVTCPGTVAGATPEHPSSVDTSEAAVQCISSSTALLGNRTSDGLLDTSVSSKSSLDGSCYDQACDSVLDTCLTAQQCDVLPARVADAHDTGSEASRGVGQLVQVQMEPEVDRLLLEDSDASQAEGSTAWPEHSTGEQAEVAASSQPKEDSSIQSEDSRSSNTSSRVAYQEDDAALPLLGAGMTPSWSHLNVSDAADVEATCGTVSLMLSDSSSNGNSSGLGGGSSSTSGGGHSSNGGCAGLDNDNYRSGGLSRNSNSDGGHSRHTNSAGHARSNNNASQSSRSNSADGDSSNDDNGGVSGGGSSGHEGTISMSIGDEAAYSSFVQAVEEVLPRSSTAALGTPGRAQSSSNSSLRFNSDSKTNNTQDDVCTLTDTVSTQAHDLVSLLSSEALPAGATSSIGMLEGCSSSASVIQAAELAASSDMAPSTSSDCKNCSSSSSSSSSSSIQADVSDAAIPLTLDRSCVACSTTASSTHQQEGPADQQGMAADERAAAIDQQEDETDQAGRPGLSICVSPSLWGQFTVRAAAQARADTAAAAAVAPPASQGSSEGGSSNSSMDHMQQSNSMVVLPALSSATASSVKLWSSVLAYSGASVPAVNPAAVVMPAAAVAGTDAPSALQACDQATTPGCSSSNGSGAGHEGDLVGDEQASLCDTAQTELSTETVPVAPVGHEEAVQVGRAYSDCSTMFLTPVGSLTSTLYLTPADSKDCSSHTVEEQPHSPCQQRLQPPPSPPPQQQQQQQQGDEDLVHEEQPLSPRLVKPPVQVQPPSPRPPQHEQQAQSSSPRLQRPPAKQQPLLQQLSFGSSVTQRGAGGALRSMHAALQQATATAKLEAAVVAAVAMMDHLTADTPDEAWEQAADALMGSLEQGTDLMHDTQLEVMPAEQAAAEGSQATASADGSRCAVRPCTQPKQVAMTVTSVPAHVPAAAGPHQAGVSVQSVSDSVQGTSGGCSNTAPGQFAAEKVPGQQQQQLVQLHLHVEQLPAASSPQQNPDSDHAQQLVRLQLLVDRSSGHVHCSIMLKSTAAPACGLAAAHPTPSSTEEVVQLHVWLDDCDMDSGDAQQVRCVIRVVQTPHSHSNVIGAGRQAASAADPPAAPSKAYVRVQLTVLPMDDSPSMAAFENTPEGAVDDSPADGDEVHASNPKVQPACVDDVFGDLYDPLIQLSDAVREDPLAALEAAFGARLVQALRSLRPAPRHPLPAPSASEPDPFEGVLDYEQAALVATKALEVLAGAAQAGDSSAPHLDQLDADQAQALADALQHGLFQDLLQELQQRLGIGIHAQSPKPKSMVVEHEEDVIRRHWEWVAHCEAMTAAAAAAKERQRQDAAAAVEEAASRRVVSDVVAAVFGSVQLSAAAQWKDSSTLLTPISQLEVSPHTIANTLSDLPASCTAAGTAHDDVPPAQSGGGIEVPYLQLGRQQLHQGSAWQEGGGGGSDMPKAFAASWPNQPRMRVSASTGAIAGLCAQPVCAAAPNSPQLLSRGSADEAALQQHVAVHRISNEIEPADQSDDPGSLRSVRFGASTVRSVGPSNQQATSQLLTSSQLCKDQPATEAKLAVQAAATTAVMCTSTSAPCTTAAAVDDYDPFPLPPARPDLHETLAPVDGVPLIRLSDDGNESLPSVPNTTPAPLSAVHPAHQASMEVGPEMHDNDQPTEQQQPIDLDAAPSLRHFVTEDNILAAWQARARSSSDTSRNGDGSDAAIGSASAGPAAAGKLDFSSMRQTAPQDSLVDLLDGAAVQTVQVPQPQLQRQHLAGWQQQALQRLLGDDSASLTLVDLGGMLPERHKPGVPMTDSPKQPGSGTKLFGKAWQCSPPPALDLDKVVGPQSAPAAATAHESGSAGSTLAGKVQDPLVDLQPAISLALATPTHSSQHGAQLHMEHASPQKQALLQGLQQPGPAVATIRTSPDVWLKEYKTTGREGGVGETAVGHTRQASASSIPVSPLSSTGPSEAVAVDRESAVFKDLDPFLPAEDGTTDKTDGCLHSSTSMPCSPIKGARHSKPPSPMRPQSASKLAIHHWSRPSVPAPSAPLLFGLQSAHSGLHQPSEQALITHQDMIPVHVAYGPAIMAPAVMMPQYPAALASMYSSPVQPAAHMLGATAVPSTGGVAMPAGMMLAGSLSWQQQGPPGQVPGPGVPTAAHKQRPSSADASHRSASLD